MMNTINASNASNASNRPANEELLSECAWVRRLAGRLVADEHLAEDLAQQTMVAALRHPVAPRRSPRAWLGTVLRNLVRDASRREQRRLRREIQTAAERRSPSTVEVVERAETHSTVVQAVLALQEPYRSMILMRFFDDLPPRKIARRLNLPVSTVNTRLQRGLDRLRVELDRSHTGDRARWRRDLLLFLAPPVKLAPGVGLARILLIGIPAVVVVTMLVIGLRHGAAPRPATRFAPPTASVPDRLAPANVPPPAPEKSALVKTDSRASPEPPPESAPPKAPPVAPAAVATHPPPGMTYIPGGTAIIGLDEEEIQDLGLESIVELQLLAGSVPRHEVLIEDFYLDTIEITNEQWRLYLQSSGRGPSLDLVEFYWKDGKVPEGQENHPVTCISFKEASDYAAWAGKRLPTEEEWEYAARGAGGFLYPWGDEFDADRAHCSMSKMVGGRRAQECGTLEAGASPFGVLDLAGNVWEWTTSSYVAYEGYHDIQISTRYTRGQAEAYAATALFNAQKRVIRGGSWQNPKTALISALRQPADVNTWNTTVGFRCAWSPAKVMK